MKVQDIGAALIESRKASYVDLVGAGSAKDLKPLHDGDRMQMLCSGGKPKVVSPTLNHQINPKP